jgi:hypothetical protein
MPLAVNECDREGERKRRKSKIRRGNEIFIRWGRGRDLLDPERSAVARARREQSGEIMILIGLFVCNSGYVSLVPKN